MRLPSFRALAARAFLLSMLVAPVAGQAHAQAQKPAAPVTPVSAATLRADEFKVSLIAAQQIDRFNPGVAASENSVAAGGMTTGLDFDFHVANLPVKKKSTSNPRVYFSGRMLMGDRVMAEDSPVLADSAAGVVAHDSIVVYPNAKSVEMSGAFRISYPIYSVNSEAVTAIYLRGESGAIFAEHMTGDLISVTRFALGFERLGGTFEGSFVEIGRGHNETFGSTYGSGRYTVHVLIQGGLAPPEGSRRTHSNLGAFVELEVDTDNKGGPDGVRALLGLRLNGAGLFEGLRGLAGM